MKTNTNASKEDPSYALPKYKGPPVLENEFLDYWRRSSHLKEVEKRERYAWRRLVSNGARTLKELRAIFRAQPQLLQSLKETDPEFWGGLDVLLEQESDDLAWLCFESVENLPEHDSKTIIAGLLRIGEKLGITAGPKKFKSWMLLYIAYCVSNGLPFLDFEITKAKVIIFDLELSRRALRRRLELIQKALGQGDFKNLEICSLRGKARLFCKKLDQIKDRIREEGFEVVIIDPVYKFLLGKEENSNGLVAEMLEELTTFCMEAEVAMIYVHHHSKGNQAAKDSLDRSSGAGAWSRDPDAVMDLVEHQESNEKNRVFVAETTVRDFPQIEKFVVRWAFPLMLRDQEGLDPEALKQPKKAGRPPGDAEEQIIISLRTAECVATLPGLTVKELETATHLSNRTLHRWLKKMNPARVRRCVPIKGYQLSLSERQRVPNNQNGEDNGSESNGVEP